MKESELRPHREKEKLPLFDKMLVQPKFQKAVRTAAKHTAKTGLETGFRVDMIDSSFWIEEVKVGGTDSMSDSQTLKQIDGPFDFCFFEKQFFNLHFHPPAEGSIIPSPNDLTHLFGQKEVEYGGIGRVNNEGKVKILVIPAPRYPVTESDIEYYQEECEKVHTQEEARTLLGELGLSSFFVDILIL